MMTNDMSTDLHNLDNMVIVVENSIATINATMNRI